MLTENAFQTGLPDFSFCYVHAKARKYMSNYHKMCQMDLKVPKSPENIPKFSISRPTKKLTQIGGFGLKIYHLATLVSK
jgi:hypothetical protein